MENLNLILAKLKAGRNSFKGKYYIPKLWNYVGFKNYSTDPGRNGEILVNPYEFFIDCIETHILSNSKSASNDEVSLENSVIYSILPRMFTAWNHHDKLQNGTFLKAICLLPYLKKMHVNIIYLLPVFEHSNSYRKGETGSPYSIKNIYNLDRNLHDDLLGKDDGSLIETEFSAFVEACHSLGMKVMVDFVFRTVARDSDLIINHPDWFYWIKSRFKNSFCAPHVETLKKPTVVSGNVVSKLYKSNSINKYLAQFSRSPDELDAKKWELLQKKHNNTGENILELIEEEFGITTVPGFSDVINDPQPPWSDATYLKFYFDSHREAKRYLDKNQPPYILHDIAKLNLFRGEMCNTGLWSYTVDVIPYYQNKFGIDGARIDMGHALPPDLNREIIQKAKSINKNFLLWSEEFNCKNSKKVKSDGFHFMTGSLWYDYKNVEKASFYKKVVKSLTTSEIPVTGALESPDTPRAAYNYKNKNKLEMMVFLNHFMPNIVPMINNGMDIMEVQPMNLGLDNNEEGRFVLDKSDPMYGKLAFFDNYRLHWANPESDYLSSVLEKASILRERFLSVIADKENLIYQPELEKNKKILFLCYFDEKLCKNVFFLANRSSRSKAIVNFKRIIPEKLSMLNKIKFVFKDKKLCDAEWDFENSLVLSPTEVIIGSISYEGGGSYEGQGKKGS